MRGEERPEPLSGTSSARSTTPPTATPTLARRKTMTQGREFSIVACAVSLGAWVLVCRAGAGGVMAAIIVGRCCDLCDC